MPTPTPHKRTITDTRPIAKAAGSWWPAALLIFGFAIWALGHLGGFAWTWDEGVMLMTGRMLEQGHTLYDPLWYNYTPLVAQLLAISFRLFGATAQVGRAFMVLCSVLALAGTSRLVWAVTRDGVLAALTTGLMITAWPFLANSRAVQADIPALGLAVWSLVVAYRQERGLSGGDAAISGALFGLSMACKPTSVFVLVPLAYALWSHADRRVRNTLFFGLGAAATLACSLAFVDLAAFWAQFAGSMASQQQGASPPVIDNLGKMWQLVTFAKYGPPQYLFPVLCLAGVWALVSSKSTMRWLISTWLGAGAMVWLLYSPLYSHHLVTLLPSLVILAALGIMRVFGWLGDRMSQSGRAWQIVACVAIVLFQFAATGLSDTSLALPDEDDEDEDALVAAEIVRNLVPDNGYFVTDSLSLAFAAERMVPPEMVNTSSWRLKSGQLDSQSAIAWTSQYHAPAVVFWDDRLEDYAKAYVDWVRSNYYLHAWYGKERRIYYQQNAPEIDTRIAYEGLWLDGYTIDRSDPDVMRIQTYWRATESQAHATCEATFYMARDDEAPILLLKQRLAEGGMRPSHWQAGDRVVRSFALPLGNLEAGEYELLLGLEHGEEMILAETPEGQAELASLGTWRQP